MSHTNKIGGKCPLPRYRDTRVSWHKADQFPVGAWVFDVHDERHVGRVDAFINGEYRVTFENGTRADIPKHRARLTQG